MPGFAVIKQIMSVNLYITSIFIDRELEDFIAKMIKSKKAETKAQIVRMALKLLAEEEALKDLAEAQIDVVKGRVYKGDLKKLLQTVKSGNHNT